MRAESRELMLLLSAAQHRICVSVSAFELVAVSAAVVVAAIVVVVVVFGIY